MRYAPRGRMRALSYILLLTGLAAAPIGTAFAQDAKVRAREAYATGEAAAKAGKWDEAARAFSLADSLAPNDTALESALNAAERGSDAALGMNLAERAKRAKNLETMPVTVSVRKKFEARVGVVKIPCVAATPPCIASIDGERVDRERTWAVPGSRKVVFDREGEKAEVSVDLSVGAESEVSPPLAAPKPPERTAPTEPIVPPEETEESGASPLWLLIPGGVTLAAGATTIAFAVLTSGKETELTDLQEAGRQADESEATYADRQRVLVEDGEAWQDRTNVLIGVTIGAAAATAAVAIFAVDWGGGESPAVALVPTFGGLVVGGSFQ